MVWMVCHIRSYVRSAILRNISLICTKIIYVTRMQEPFMVQISS